MDSTFYYIPESDSLVHHGTKGQHWGHRRYQNADGSLTPEGRERYRKPSRKKFGQRRAEKKLVKASQAMTESEKNYKEAIARRKKNPDDFDSFENKEIRALAELASEQKQYKAAVNKYIKKYGDESYKTLKLYNNKNDYAKKFVEMAIDDSIEVMSGTRTAESYNRKYEGTGWRYNQ